MTQPFAKLNSNDARTVAQQEFAELTDWKRRLDVADFEFSEQQWDVIEALFSEADRVEIKSGRAQSRYLVARRVIQARIEALRKFLGLPEPKETNETSSQTD